MTSSLVFFCFNCGSLIGCSGGVYCLMAAALATLILNWKEDKAILWKFRRDKAPFAMAGRMYQILKLVTIFSFATLDFGSAAYWMLTGSEEDSGVRASLIIVFATMSTRATTSLLSSSSSTSTSSASTLFQRSPGECASAHLRLPHRPPGRLQHLHGPD